MSVVKKTISIPEELYEQLVSEGEGLSKIVRRALEEYIKKRKKEKAISLWGKLKDWEIEDGMAFVDRVRKEQLEVQKDRKEWPDT